jgi:hypothetical protein
VRVAYSAEVCPDGVEVHQPPPLIAGTGGSFFGEVLAQDPGPCFRFISSRRSTKDIVYSSLEDSLVAIKFANIPTGDVDGLSKFQSIYGLMYPPVHQLESVWLLRGQIRSILFGVLGLSGFDEGLRISVDNDALERLVERVNKWPPATQVHISDEQTIGWSLKAKSLVQYMQIEVLIAGWLEATMHRCKHCGDLFLSGATSRRRSDALFCRDRCRVANHRKSKETTNIGERNAGTQA